MSMGIEVSIIIPNWNGGDVLTECLESILVNTQDTDFELIIVDNGSTDSSPHIIRQLAESDDRVKPIFNRENFFFARACNQGFEISAGRYIIVGNNDIVLQDDAVKALVEYADAHPEVGAVTPRFCDRAGTPLEFFRRLPNSLYVIAHYHPVGRALDRFLLGRRFEDRYFYRDRTFTQIEEIEQPGASFTLVRRQLIDRLGFLFDEQFPLLFNDVDLSRRINDVGSVSHVVPKIQVVHLEGVSSQKFSQSAYQHLLYRGMFDFFKKHHPFQFLLLCVAWPKWWWASLFRSS
jgi:GT2 family glycosyltransferase